MTVFRMVRMGNVTNDWWGCKLFQPFFKTIQQNLLKVHTSFGLATQFLEIYPTRKNIIVRKLYQLEKYLGKHL